MFKKLIAIAVTSSVGVTAVPPATAIAQAVCGKRGIIVAKLADTYGEERHGGGLAESTTIFEILASDETGTWTILKTTPDGYACIMAVGDNWRDYGRKQTLVVIDMEPESPLLTLGQRLEIRRLARGGPRIRVRRAGKIQPPINYASFDLKGGDPL